MTFNEAKKTVKRKFDLSSLREHDVGEGWILKGSSYPYVIYNQIRNGVKADGLLPNEGITEIGVILFDPKGVTLLDDPEIMGEGDPSMYGIRTTVMEGYGTRRVGRVHTEYIMYPKGYSGTVYSSYREADIKLPEWLMKNAMEMLDAEMAEHNFTYGQVD